jgi:Rod binding domain-containing protein
MDVMSSGLSLVKRLADLLPLGPPSAGGAALVSEALSLGAASTPPKQDAQAAVQFESLFWSMMLKEMRQSLESDTLFGNDSGDVLGGLFDMFIGQHISQAQALGIASLVRQQLENATTEDRTGRVPIPIPNKRTDVVEPMSKAP